MPEASRRYALITPCRDEEAFARRTLDSVCSQSLLPALWLIVDDGSTDATPEILAEYAAKYPFIQVLRREDRGARAVGPGVIEAFYAGFEKINPQEYDYICKFDLDLDLHPQYFETVVQHMEAEPRLGTFSGKPYARENGKLVPEPCGDEMSVGMSKFYRVNCFAQTGGFVREVMWDGIDCHRARMLGWMAAAADDEEALRFEHLRPMGSSQKGILTGRMRHGFGQWFMGTGPVYMAASAVFRMAHYPLVVGGLAMFWGYLRSALQCASRYEDPEFRRFLRHYQWRSLLRGKQRAIDEITAETASRWSPT